METELLEMKDKLSKYDDEEIAKTKIDLIKYRETAMMAQEDNAGIIYKYRDLHK